MTEIPPLGLLPYRPNRARPYFYSDLEIQQLLQAAKARTSCDPLRPWTYYCFFGLLAVAGLRLSEALNLRAEDLDWSEGILTIRDTKFGKSRLVPLHASTCKVLSAYAKRRDRRFGARPVAHFFVNKNGNRSVLKAWLREQGQGDSKILFPSTRGGRLSAVGVQHMVGRHVAKARKTCPTLRKKRVSPHVLRHAAAMELLQAGVDRAVIALWLGHESVETTQIYLDADLALKEQVLAKTKPPKGKVGRYRPDDDLLTFLKGL
jgi:integrase